MLASCENWVNSRHTIIQEKPLERRLEQPECLFDTGLQVPGRKHITLLAQGGAPLSGVKKEPT